MKRSIVILLVMTFAIAVSEDLYTNEKTESGSGETCKFPKNLTYGYRIAFYKYLLSLQNLIAVRSDLHFVFSARSIGLLLGAVVEQADTKTRQKLLNFLQLPEDTCLRHKYYDVAINCMAPGDDVEIRSKSFLVVDESLKVKSQWKKLVTSDYPILRVVELPIKSKPEESIKYMGELISADLSGLNVTGNSALLDTIDFNGLWTTAFAENSIERSPFYNQQGDKIGYVDMMRMKKRVKINYMSEMKVVEIPIGKDERYRLVMVTFESNDLALQIKEITAEMLQNIIEGLEGTEEEVEVAVPKIGLMSQIDVRKILEEDVGIKDLWDDEKVTRSVSEPAALPSSFVHRSTLIFDSEGVKPARTSEPFVSLKSDRNFIANRPFLAMIIDAKTYTALVTALISKPTYPN